MQTSCWLVLKCMNGVGKMKYDNERRLWHEIKADNLIMWERKCVWDGGGGWGGACCKFICWLLNIREGCNYQENFLLLTYPLLSDMHLFLALFLFPPFFSLFLYTYQYMHPFYQTFIFHSPIHLSLILHPPPLLFFSFLSLSLSFPLYLVILELRFTSHISLWNGAESRRVKFIGFIISSNR